MGHLPEITGRALSTDRPLTLGVLAAHEKLTTQPLSNPLQLQNIDVQLMTAPRTSRAYCLPALSHLFQTQSGNFTERMQRIHFYSLGSFLTISLS